LTVRAATRPSLVVDERTNAIFVRGTEAAVREVTDLLKLLDAPDARNLDFPSTTPLEPAAKDLKAVPVTELRQRSEALEQQCRELAGKLKQPLKSPVEGARLKDSLSKTVHEAFATRQELQRVELAEFTNRLQGLRQSLEMRQRIADKIIDRRIEELLDPNLNWEAATPLTPSPTADASSPQRPQPTEASPPFDKSALPKVTDNSNYRSQTTFLNGLASGDGIIERIDGDTIHLRSGDRFVVPAGTMVEQLMPGRTMVSHRTSVLEPGMAIGYSIRNGKLERLILTGSVSDKSVFDTIKVLKLRKGGEVNDGIDGRHPIRLTGKNGEFSIKIGETKLIELPKSTKTIEWRAGDFKPEVIDDSEPFDYLLVQWRDNSRITWTCYASPAIPVAGTNEAGATAYESVVRSLPFEFRLAQFEPTDDFDEFTVPGSEQKVSVDRKPVAMMFDVAAARVIDDANGQPAIEISYRLEERWTAIVGRPQRRCSASRFLGILVCCLRNEAATSDRHS